MTCSKRFLAVALLVVTTLVAGASVDAQTGPASSAPAQFDVASIREDTSGAQEGFFRFANGRFTVTSMPVRWIIRWAYGLRDYQVTGLPNWTETRYEIQATYAPHSAGLDAVKVMTQRLLADRFALRARRESREMRGYHLVKASAAGPLGPKLRPSDVDCGQPAPPAPVVPGKPPVPRCTAWVNYGMVHGFSRTMPQLAAYLDDLVGAPVVDRTGLGGVWNFDVEWTVPARSDASAELRTPPVESIAGLFTALEDALGLRLTATRGPVDVLVIDAVSRPTSN